jgi:hypothetical protein
LNPNRLGKSRGRADEKSMKGKPLARSWTAEFNEIKEWKNGVFLHFGTKKLYHTAIMPCLAVLPGE